MVAKQWQDRGRVVVVVMRESRGEEGGGGGEVIERLAGQGGGGVNIDQVGGGATPTTLNKITAFLLPGHK